MKKKRKETLDELTQLSQDMGFYDKDFKFTTAEEYVKDQEQYREKVKKLRDKDPFIYD